MRGRSLDISVAGIAGVFVTGWELGTRVLIEFSVPVTQQRVQVEAIVRNRSGYRYGFEFLNLAGRDRALINKTCRVLALLQ
jgi:c-di-GMP-binding flagellar brake protein YcgR